jgi:hypothetical protein
MTSGVSKHTADFFGWLEMTFYRNVIFINHQTLSIKRAAKNKIYPFAVKRQEVDVEDSISFCAFFCMFIAHSRCRPRVRLWSRGSIVE